MVYFPKRSQLFKKLTFCDFLVHNYQNLFYYTLFLEFFPNESFTYFEKIFKLFQKIFQSAIIALKEIIVNHKNVEYYL